MKNVKIISGTANLPLAKEISKKLGIPLLKVDIQRFKDGEIYVRLLEHVRQCHVFIIQPTAPYVNDVNNNLMELAILIDACKRASAVRVDAIVPYYGYARQDRKAKGREPITAKLVANILESAGASRAVMMDLHSDQIQGFFDFPCDNLSAVPLFMEYIKKLKLKDLVVLAPDIGSTKKSGTIAEILGVPLVIIEKRRPKHNEVVVANLIGDVKDKNVIVIDDMIDTAGTITAATDTIKKFGAKDVYIFASHALLSGEAPERLQKCAAKQVIVTNTINIPEDRKFPKLKVLDLAPFLAEGIKRIYKGESVSELYRVEGWKHGI